MVYRGLFTSVLTACLVHAGSVADELASAARGLIQERGNAVVTVRLAMKMSFAFGPATEQQEMVQEVTGAMVQPDGLTVLSLTATEPTSIFGMMFSMFGEEQEGFSMDSQITDVKIILPDGKEIPGQVVLRDRDLDLAFVRPMDPPTEPFAAVDLSQSAAPEQMDLLVVLFRMGRVAGRACGATVQRIEGIVEKPRKYYFLQGNMMATMFGGAAFLGAPAFTPTGQCAGVTVLRKMKSTGGTGPEIALVVLPAQDVLEIAQQAPMKAAPEEEPQPPAEEAAPTVQPEAEAPAEQVPPSEQPQGETPTQ